MSTKIDRVTNTDQARKWLNRIKGVTARKVYRTEKRSADPHKWILLRGKKDAGIAELRDDGLHILGDIEPPTVRERSSAPQKRTTVRLKMHQWRYILMSGEIEYGRISQGIRLIVRHKIMPIEPRRFEKNSAVVRAVSLPDEIWVQLLALHKIDQTVPIPAGVRMVADKIVKQFQEVAK